MQIASDVIRDGLGLELLDEDETPVAEVFRCDTDRTVTVSIFDASVPDEQIEALIAQASTALGTFEDGTPLPETFEIRGVGSPESAGGPGASS